MRRKFNLYLGLAILLLCCSKSDYDILAGQIQSFSAPDTVLVGTPFEVEVTFSGGNNGCAQAERLETNRSGGKTVVSAYYRLPREEQICTMVVPMHRLPLSMAFTTPGNHTITDQENQVVHTFTVVE